MKEAITIIKLLSDLYYMMGIIEGSGCKVMYDFVLEDIDRAERIIEDFTHSCEAEVE